MSEQFEQRGEDPLGDAFKDKVQFANDFFAAQVASVKRYCTARHNIHVHLSVSLESIEETSMNPGYYCLTFEDSVVLLDNIEVGKASRYFETSGGIECEVHPSTLPVSNVDEPVFVRIGQLIESPENLPFITCAHFIRLHPLYNCARLRANLLDHSRDVFSCEIGSSATEVTLPVFVPDDWELTRTCLLLAQAAGVLHSQGKDHVIKSASEILDTISEDGRERLNGRGMNRALYEHVVGAVRVRFDGARGKMHVLFARTPGMLLQLFEVIKRPSDLNDTTGHWGHDGPSPRDHSYLEWTAGAKMGPV